MSQLVVEPPVLTECHPDVPSIKEVDNLLVSCVGQMAVTAGSDLLWKPLNHEVTKRPFNNILLSHIDRFWNKYTGNRA